MTDFLDKLKKSPDRLASVAKELAFRSFTENEIQFVEEFLKVMKPVALALDNLQGDVGLGHILPTVSDVYTCFEGKKLGASAIVFLGDSRRELLFEATLLISSMTA